MAHIQQPRPAPEFVPGKQNTITAVAPAQLYAVNFVNGQSQKSMALIIVFGKDAEDGGPGVFVLANEHEMNKQLKLATPMIKKEMRKWLARLNDPTAEEVPEGIDLGVVDGPAAGDSVDLKKLGL